MLGQLRCWEHVAEAWGSGLVCYPQHGCKHGGRGRYGATLMDVQLEGGGIDMGKMTVIGVVRKAYRSDVVILNDINMH